VEPIDPNYLQHQLIFLVGIFIQAFRMIPIRTQWKALLGIALFSIVMGLIPGKHEDVYDLHFHLWAISFVYVLLLFPLFSTYLLPKLTEFDLILQTVYAWAIIAFGPWSQYLVPYMPYISAGMACILMYIILPIIHGKKTEVLIYMWMPFLSVVMMIFYIPSLVELPFHMPLTPLSAIQTFSVGMTGFLFFRNILALFHCLPLKGKRESMEEAMERLREYLVLVREKMDDAQINPGIGVILACVLVAAIFVLEARSPGASTYYLPIFLTVSSVLYEARIAIHETISPRAPEE
jgi:hypothetical protein